MSHAKRLSLPPALHWRRPCLTQVVPSRAYELIVDVLGHDSNGVAQRLQAATALSTQVRRQASGARVRSITDVVAILGRPGDAPASARLEPITSSYSAATNILWTPDKLVMVRNEDGQSDPFLADAKAGSKVWEFAV